jgi:hypothetical protein
MPVWFQFAAPLLTAVLAVWLYQELLPVLTVRIRVAEKDGHMLLFHLEAENKSRLPARVTLARFQILEHNISGANTLSEWVPFDKSRVRPDEQPVEWKDPVEVLETTRFVKPGEIITVERGYRPTPGTAVHCAYQVQIRPNLIAGWLYGHSPSFTTTTWVIPNASGPAPGIQEGVLGEDRQI